MVQTLEDYEQAEEEKAFMRTVVDGLSDLDNRRKLDLDGVKIRLGVKL